MSFILLSLFVITLDQLLKIAVVRFLSPGDSIPLIKDFFHITLVLNKGAAFGIFKDETQFFIILSIFAILSIVYFLPRLGKDEAVGRFSLALILGGAAGNLVDRTRFGYVIDFLDFRVWPVFNIADSAITIGAVLFAVGIIKGKSKVKSQN